MNDGPFIAAGLVDVFGGRSVAPLWVDPRGGPCPCPGTPGVRPCGCSRFSVVRIRTLPDGMPPDVRYSVQCPKCLDACYLDARDRCPHCRPARRARHYGYRYEDARIVGHFDVISLRFVPIDLETPSVF